MAKGLAKKFGLAKNYFKGFAKKGSAKTFSKIY